MRLLICSMLIASHPARLMTRSTTRGPEPENVVLFTLRSPAHRCHRPGTDRRSDVLQHFQPDGSRVPEFTATRRGYELHRPSAGRTYYLLLPIKTLTASRCLWSANEASGTMTATPFHSTKPIKILKTHSTSLPVFKTGAALHLFGHRSAVSYHDEHRLLLKLQI